MELLYKAVAVRFAAAYFITVRVLDRIIREKDSFLAAPLRYGRQPGVRLREWFLDWVAELPLVNPESRSVIRDRLRPIIVWPLTQLSNALSLVRVYLAWELYSSPQQEADFYLWILFWAIVTDVYDGIAAREYGLVSWIGKILDPICDKLLAGAAIYHFWQRFWPIAVIPCLAFEGTLLFLGLIGIAAKLRKVVLRTELGSNRLGQAKYVVHGMVLFTLVMEWYLAANLLLLAANCFAAGSIYGHLKPKTAPQAA